MPQFPGCWLHIHILLKTKLSYRVVVSCLPPSLVVLASANPWRLVSPSRVGFRTHRQHRPNTKPMTTNHASHLLTSPASLLPLNIQSWRGSTLIHSCHYLHGHVFKMYLSWSFSSHTVVFRIWMIQLLVQFLLVLRHYFLNFLDVPKRDISSKSLSRVSPVHPHFSISYFSTSLPTGAL